MYAALGLGLVLVHRASGVVNFAHGAMAMLVTYAFVELRPDIGLRPALAVSVVAAAALGLAVDGLVFRPLRRAPALARVVASVGLLATFQALAVLWFGTDSRPVPSLLPNRPVSLLGVDVPRDRLLLAVLVVLAATGLWALYRFTRFGLASRATAEDQVALAMLGWSPGVVSAVNWMLASVLAGLAGIVVGPITALDPATTTLLVVPALAAALAGRLSSFGATVGVALGLGMAQSALLKVQDDLSWVPRSGVGEALPLVVILVALGRRRGTQPGPGDARRTAPAPRHPGPAPLAVDGLRPGRGAAGVLLLGGQYRLGLVNSLIGAVICLSLVVLTGYVGQISLAQMAFAGVAGFSLAKLTATWDVPFPVAPLVAAGLAAVVGVVVGLPALRLRGLSLAVVTLAAAVAVEEAVFKSPALTGGFEGTRVPELAGVGRTGSRGFGLVALAVLAAVALAVTALRRARLGRRFLAVRANERAAAACGVNLTATKLTAFALSALVAGLGGAMLGYGQGRLSFGSFGVFVSLSYLAAAYLGGIASVSGALLGGLLVPSGLIFTVVDGKYQLLVVGISLIAVAILRPQGIVGRPDHEGTHVSGLEVRGLTVRFGPVAAVTDLDLDLPAGAVTGLIGPNGAGKTTVIDALSGLVPARPGASPSTAPRSSACPPIGGPVSAWLARSSRWSCSRISRWPRTCWSRPRRPVGGPSGRATWRPRTGRRPPPGPALQRPTAAGGPDPGRRRTPDGAAPRRAGRRPRSGRSPGPRPTPPTAGRRRCGHPPRRPRPQPGARRLRSGHRPRPGSSHRRRPARRAAGRPRRPGRLPGPGAGHRITGGRWRRGRSPHPPPPHPWAGSRPSDQRRSQRPARPAPRPPAPPQMLRCSRRRDWPPATTGPTWCTASTSPSAGARSWPCSG